MTDHAELRRLLDEAFPEPLKRIETWAGGLVVNERAIIAAINSLPALLDELDRLRAEVKAFQHYADAIAEVCTPKTFEQIQQKYNLRIEVEKGDE